MTQQIFHPSTPEEIEATLMTEMRAVVGDSAASLIQELAPMFLEDAPRLITQIAAAVSRRDAVRLKEHAHTLKGSSGSMGIKTLSKISYDLELIGRDAQLDEAHAKLGQLEAEYAAVEEALLRYIA